MLNNILYVEDEPDIQEIAKLALETLGGFTVKICGNGEQAIREAPSFKPDLILMDVMMPGMDGPTTLQELRKNASLTNTPVIFMTAKVQAHEVEHYMSIGAIEVISKPFDPMTLSDKVKTIWGQYKQV